MTIIIKCPNPECLKDNPAGSHSCWSCGAMLERSEADDPTIERELDTLRHDLEKMTQTVNSLTRDLDEKTQELHDSRQAHKNLNDDHTKLQENHATLRDDHTKLKNDHGKLDNEIQGLTKDNQGLKNEIQELLKHFFGSPDPNGSWLSKLMANLRQRFPSVVAPFTPLPGSSPVRRSTTIATALAMLLGGGGAGGYWWRGDASEQIKQVKDQLVRGLKEGADKLEVMEARANKAEGDFETAKNANSGLETRASRAEQGRTEAEARANKAEQDAGTANTAKSAAEASANAANTAKSAAETRATQLDVALRNANTARSAAEANANAANTAKSAAETKATEAETKASTLQNQLNSRDRDLSAARAEGPAAQQRLAEAQTTASNLQNQVSLLTNKNAETQQKLDEALAKGLDLASQIPSFRQIISDLLATGGKPVPYDSSVIDGISNEITRNPNDHLLYKHRGTLYAQYGLWAKAADDLGQALRLKANDPQALNQQCLARGVFSNFDTALQHCRAGLALNPDPATRAQLFDSLGLVYLKRGEPGDLDAAKDAYQSALALEPSLPTAKYGLGLAKIRTGNATGGKADTDMAKSVHPTIEQEFISYGIRP